MSQANVEVVKRAIDAFNRRDFDAFGDLYTLDFEWFPAMAEAVEGGGYAGLTGAERYYEEIDETWEGLHVVADEFRDLGDCVLVLGRIEGRGGGSGVPVDAPHGVICDLRDGKIWRSRNFLDHGEALRAAGLSE